MDGVCPSLDHEREEYYRGQRKLNLQFEKDLIECYGMTGHPKAQELFNIAREGETIDDIIFQFGELVIRER